MIQNIIVGFLRTLVAGTLSAGILYSPAPAAAQSDGSVRYYWVTPGPLYPNIPKQSFVIAVDPGTAAQIEAIRAQGGRPGFSGQIAEGSVDYNKNYYAPGQPRWNWHVTSVAEVFDLNSTFFPQCECPYLIAHPSDIAVNPAEWIRQNGSQYTPVRYEITAQIDPEKKDRIANVSNRGLAGNGERTLITGLIISGGEPRNVIVRALGPSLGPLGVQQPAGNPKLEVYNSSKKIATNADWRMDARADTIRASYPSLAPGNEKEAAMLLTLLPGAYTMHGINEDGTEGVMLLEAYDVDAGSQ